MVIGTTDMIVNEGDEDMVMMTVNVTWHKVALTDPLTGVTTSRC